MDSDDESINSEDLNELQNELGVVFEEKQVKGTCDRKGYTQKEAPVLTISKPIDIPDRDSVEQPENVIIEKQSKAPPKRKGRPPKPIEEKLAKQVITKEKVIYMIPDNNGGYTEYKNPPKLTKKDMKKIENEKKFKEEQEQIGKKLLQKRNGTTDKRSLPKKEPTQKQIEARKRFVEMNKKRAEDRRKKKNEDLERIVHNSVVEVVKTPASQIQKKPDPVQQVQQPVYKPMYTISPEEIAKKKRLDFLRKKMGL